jgi:ATP-dependent RNA helicase DOB1
MEVVPVVLSCIHDISHIRIFLPKDIQAADTRMGVKKSMAEIQRRFPDGLPLLDPIENMKIEDDSFKKLLRVRDNPFKWIIHAANMIQKIEVLDSRLLSNPLHNSPRLPELYEQYAEKVDLGTQIKAAKKKISDAMEIMQLEELKNRKRVLRRVGFINEDEVVQLKGRVACEISSGDELVLSELLFNGFFNNLTPEQIAAIMSCFVFEEKVKEAPPLSKDELAKPLREIQSQARTIAKVSQESKMALNEDEYVQSFKWELMEVVYDWSQGKSFADIW